MRRKIARRERRLTDPEPAARLYSLSVQFSSFAAGGINSVQ
ncbi:MAG: hypothetical protein ABTR92_08725 [Candidatus Accumulibacter phosphatis]